MNSDARAQTIARVRKHLPPELLYKYYRVSDYSLDVLLTQSVYFANPIQDFNDPFDCRLLLNMSGTLTEWERKVRRLYQERGQKAPTKTIRQNALRLLKMARAPKAAAHAVQRILRSIAVLSLSASKDNLLMWSHYAEGHKGFCITLDTRIFDALDFMWTPGGNYMRRVDYTRKYDQVAYVNAPGEQMVNHILFTKSEDWGYEKEWRMVSNQGTGVRPLPVGMLIEVTIGCRTPESDVDRIRDVISRSGRSMKLYRTRTVDYEFALERFPIST